VDDHEFFGKVAHNIGLIVLASQELERQIKPSSALSTLESGDFNSRIERLERRSLGVIVKGFLRGATVEEGDPVALTAYLNKLVERRNQVVHDFFRTYARELEAGRRKEILASLASLCRELRQLGASFGDASKAIFDLLQVESDENGKFSSDD